MHVVVVAIVAENDAVAKMRDVVVEFVVAEVSLDTIVVVVVNALVSFTLGE